IGGRGGDGARYGAALYSGSGGGGGGGSGYIGGVQNGVMQSGVNSGHGRAEITFTKSEASTVVDWNKVRADVSKGIFPEYMPDGLPNPIFGCISMGYIGDITSGVGPFKGRSGSGVTLVTVKHPNANKDVSAVRLNAGA